MLEFVRLCNRSQRGLSGVSQRGPRIVTVFAFQHAEALNSQYVTILGPRCTPLTAETKAISKKIERYRFFPLDRSPNG
jgi:hypothetical protein